MILSNKTIYSLVLNLHPHFTQFIKNTFSVFIYNIKQNNGSYFFVLKQLKTFLTVFQTYNLRNKINYNKSKRSIGPTNKAGKSRTSSSASHLLRKGLVWFGLRHYKTKHFSLSTKLLLTLLINKRSFISLTNLETLKIYNELNHSYLTFIIPLQLLSPFFSVKNKFYRYLLLINKNTTITH